MSVPSIKGAAIVGTHGRLLELIDEGRISRDELEAELAGQAIEILDAKLEPSFWYPIESTEQLSRLLVNLDGAGHDRYMQESGKRTAARFQEGGVFKNFIEGALNHKGNEGPVLLKLTELVFNFGRFRFEGDSLRDFRVVMEGAAPLSDLLRLSTEGFMHVLASRVAGEYVEVRSKWTRADEIEFRGRVEER